jgi:hypothetical protein
MNYSNHRISLDIHDTASQVCIAVKRYDNQNRICAFLTEGGKPYTISEGCVAYFMAKKPDGTEVYVTATIEGNTIVHVMDSNTTAAVGRVECELRLIGADEETITGPRFTVVVEDAVVPDTDVINSSDDFSALSDLISKGNAIIEELANISQSTAVISYVDLLASEWQGTASPYSQVVSINGATENSKIDLNPSVEQLAVFHQKDIAFVAENEDGVVTVYCVGQKPTGDYSMQVTITEVIPNG